MRSAIFLMMLGGCATMQPAGDGAPLVYAMTLDERSPLTATVAVRDPPRRLGAVRGGAIASTIADPQCDGRAVPIAGDAIETPRGCRMLRWSVSLVDQDAAGVDASVPPSSWSARHRYWFLAERHGLLRPAGLDQVARMHVTMRWADGTLTRRTLDLPRLDEPPFYAVAGARPARMYQDHATIMPVWGDPPDYPWMDALHRNVLAALARWRRDVVVPGAQRRRGSISRG